MFGCVVAETMMENHSELLQWILNELFLLTQRRNSVKVLKIVSLANWKHMFMAPSKINSENNYREKEIFPGIFNRFLETYSFGLEKEKVLWTVKHLVEINSLCSIVVWLWNRYSIDKKALKITEIYAQHQLMFLWVQKLIQLLRSSRFPCRFFLPFYSIK